MPYVLSLVLAALGLVVLLVVAVRVLRELRRLRSVQREVATDITDRAGLLKARVAGLKVAFAERRRR
ncbi:bacteriophage holin [Saccharopolyspora rosea]|uniref:Bacteriophage holin n=1 Tax=Saccharopolyspora rosea TaxID=524884 RepID=A0ABW3FUK5_9PSEU|nr:bacteriophage holin [Saccharopolyspora rosea]